VTCCLKAGRLVRLSRGNGSDKRVSAATNSSVAAQRLAITGHVQTARRLRGNGWVMKMTKICITRRRSIFRNWYILYTQGIISIIKIIQIKNNSPPYITNIFNVYDIEDRVIFFIDVKKSNMNLLIHGSSSTDRSVVAYFNGIFQHSS
jgi:hypothetical protein